MNKVSWKDLLYIGLGLFLIGALALNADVTNTLDNMRNINLGILGLILFLYLANTSIKALRWSAILKGIGAKKRGLIILPIFLASLALNNSTPGKVGGEPVRAYFLREHTGTRLSLGAASIFAEKSLDMLTIITASMIGMIYLFYTLGGNSIISMGLGVGLGGVVIIGAILMMVNKKVMLAMISLTGWFVSKIPFGKARKLGEKAIIRVEGSGERFSTALRNLRGNRRMSTAVILLTCAIWVNEALRLYLVVLALPGGYHIPFIGAVATIGVANILGFLIPYGAGNVLGGTSVLKIITGEGNLSFSASFTAVATSIWLSIPLGLISLGYLKSRSKEQKWKEGGKDRLA